MSCNANSTKQSTSCRIIKVDSNTATITLNIQNGIGCNCGTPCSCGNGLNATNTYITIRRNGPVYHNTSNGCCANPQVQINNCPLTPGQFSFPLPTFLVPCNYPVAPPFPWMGGSTQVWFKFPPFVKYTLFSKQGNSLTFFLDQILYNAKSGRYIADLFVNNQYCSSQQLQLVKGCHIQSFSSQQFKRNSCDDMNPSPECC